MVQRSPVLYISLLQVLNMKFVHLHSEYPTMRTSQSLWSPTFLLPYPAAHAMSLHTLCPSDVWPTWIPVPCTQTPSTSGHAQANLVPSNNCDHNDNGVNGSSNRHLMMMKMLVKGRGGSSSSGSG